MWTNSSQVDLYRHHVQQQNQPTQGIIALLYLEYIEFKLLNFIIFIAFSRCHYPERLTEELWSQLTEALALTNNNNNIIIVKDSQKNFSFLFFSLYPKGPVPQY